MATRVYKDIIGESVSATSLISTSGTADRIQKLNSDLKLVNSEIVETSSLIKVNRDIQFNKNAKVKAGSLQVGESITLKDSGSALVIEDNTGKRFSIVQRLLPKTTGPDPAFIPKVEPETTVVEQSNDTETQVISTVNWTEIHVDDFVTNEFIFRATTATTGMRLVVRENNASGRVIARTTEDDPWNAGDGFTLAASGDTTVVLDAAIQHFDGAIVHVTLEVATGTFGIKGDTVVFGGQPSAFVPYFGEKIQKFKLPLLADGGGFNTVITGDVAITAGSAAVVGTGTLFTTELVTGQAVQIREENFTILTITDNLNLTLSANHVVGAGAGIGGGKNALVFAETDLLTIRTFNSGTHLKVEKGGPLIAHSFTGNPLKITRASILVAGLVDWEFRTELDTVVTNTKTGYQVRVTVDTQTLVTAGKMKADGSDIRITDTNGVTILPHHVESGINTTTTIIYFKADVTAGSPTYFLYHGNPDALTTDNPESVFDFYDGFGNSSIDTAKWTITDGTGFSVTGGELIGTNSTGRLRSIATFSDPIITETVFRTVTDNLNGHTALGFFNSSTDHLAFISRATTDFAFHDGSLTNLGDIVPLGVDMLVRVTGNGASSNIFIQRQDTLAVLTNTTVTATVSLETLMLGRRPDEAGLGETYDARWDFVRVRKFVATEPVVTPGTETLIKVPYLTVESSGNVVIDNQIQIKGGTPGTGKVLTSDANGLATWDTAGAVSFGFTQGSVPFAGASGDLDEDNANLFFDDTNNRLGIGESSPTSRLHVKGDTTAPAVFINQTANGIGLDINTAATTAIALDIDGDSLTSGGLATFNSNSTDTSTRILVDIVNNNTLAVGATPLHVQQFADEPTVRIDQNGNDAALLIFSSSISSPALDITNDLNQTGALIRGLSRSTSTATRNLFDLTNDDPLATGTTVMKLKQDAAQTVLDIDQNADGQAIRVFGPLNVNQTVLNVSGCNSLVFGRIAFFESNSASVSARNLVDIVNNNVLATATTCLRVQQDAPDSSTAPAAVFLGRVGVGTSAPTEKLDVDGVVRGNQILGTAAGGGSSAAIRAANGSPGIEIRQSTATLDNKSWDFLASAESLLFRVVNDANSAASNWLEVNRTGITVDHINFANGDVGIGIVPVSKLHVKQTTDAFDKGLIIEGTGGGTFRMYHTNTNTATFQKGNNTNQLVLDDNGRIGNLIAAPLADIHTKKGSTGAALTAVDVGTANLVIETLTNDVNSKLIMASNRSAGTQQTNDIEFWGNSFGGSMGHSATIKMINAQGTAAKQTTGNIVLFTSNDTLTPSEVARFTNDKRLGVGEPAPAGVLHTKGATGTDSIVIHDSDGAASGSTIQWRRNGSVVGNTGIAKAAANLSAIAVGINDMVVAPTAFGGNLILSTEIANKDILFGASTTTGSVELGRFTAAGIFDLTATTGGVTQMTEIAAVPGGTPAAGKGKFWVRSDTPNVPMFTDDAGTDSVLNVGAAIASVMYSWDNQAGNASSFNFTERNANGISGKISHAASSGTIVFESGGRYFVVCNLEAKQGSGGDQADITITGAPNQPSLTIQATVNGSGDGGNAGSTSFIVDATGAQQSVLWNRTFSSGNGNTSGRISIHEIQ